MRREFRLPLVIWLTGTVVAYAIGATVDMTALAFVQRSTTFCRRRMNFLEDSDISSLQSYSSTLLPMTYKQHQSDDDTDDTKKFSNPDLFDFFDPLLSPHAYPEGISTETKPICQSNDEVQQQQQQLLRKNRETIEQQQPQQESSLKGEFGFRLPFDSATSPNEEERNDEKKEDLFDYFDPLISPHSYPDGIETSTTPKQESMPTTITPLPLEVVSNEDSIRCSTSSSSSSSSSNHKKKIGVLLMDHGSRKEASNARLQTMAKLYQMTFNNDGIEDEHDDDVNMATPDIIVRAAHMEIATPSIAEGLKSLKDEGVDEIICHPFFLSADGRHMKEDIPQIIEEAIEDLWGNNAGATAIPIVTTAPVGSNTQLMLGAIHSLVRENSRYMKTT